MSTHQIKESLCKTCPHILQRMQIRNWSVVFCSVVDGFWKMGANSPVTMQDRGRHPELRAKLNRQFITGGKLVLTLFQEPAGDVVGSFKCILLYHHKLLFIYVTSMTDHELCYYLIQNSYNRIIIIYWKNATNTPTRIKL